MLKNPLSDLIRLPTWPPLRNGTTESHRAGSLFRRTVYVVFDIQGFRTGLDPMQPAVRQPDHRLGGG